MSLAKRIIPCLDVTNGRVVKGVNFVELRDAGDPVEISRRYDEQGADELTFLDITASSDNRDLILHIIMNHFHCFFHKMIVKLIVQNNLLLIIIRLYQFQSFLSEIGRAHV